jgi:hypothetical protein
MSDEHTTAVVERYLDELGGDSPAEPIVRALLDREAAVIHAGRVGNGSDGFRGARPHFLRLVAR